MRESANRRTCSVEIAEWPDLGGLRPPRQPRLGLPVNTPLDLVADPVHPAEIQLLRQLRLMGRKDDH